METKVYKGLEKLGFSRKPVEERMKDISYRFGIKLVVADYFWIEDPNREEPEV